MAAHPEFGESGLRDPGLVEWGERCECRLQFSIVIPAYNEEAFIGATLRSLLAQVFADPYEIIVVDNNSSDETARVAMAHGAVVVREERQGVCWARQCGTEMAAGELIVPDARTAASPRAADWTRRTRRRTAAAGQRSRAHWAQSW